MSWNIFKSSIQQIQRNPRAVDIDLYASTFAREYDSCIKRGTDLVNTIPLAQGNVQALEQSIKLALQSQQRNGNQTDIYRSIGNAVITYWVGAVGSNFPIPLIPAPGSIQNIAITSHNIVSPGTWPPTPFPIIPTQNTDIFIDNFITLAQQHLTTVSGVINTVSLYPPIGTPGPGVIPWTGYVVR